MEEYLLPQRHVLLGRTAPEVAQPLEATRLAHLLVEEVHQVGEQWHMTTVRELMTNLPLAIMITITERFMIKTGKMNMNGKMIMIGRMMMDTTGP